MFLATWCLAQFLVCTTSYIIGLYKKYKKNPHTIKHFSCSSTHIWQSVNISYIGTVIYDSLSLLITMLAIVISFLSASGWSVQDQFHSSLAIFLPPRPLSCSCLLQEPSQQFLLRWFESFAERWVICGVSHMPSHRAPSRPLTTVLGLQGSLPVRCVGTNLCCA